MIPRANHANYKRPFYIIFRDTPINQHYRVTSYQSKSNEYSWRPKVHKDARDNYEPMEHFGTFFKHRENSGNILNTSVTTKPHNCTTTHCSSLSLNVSSTKSTSNAQPSYHKFKFYSQSGHKAGSFSWRWPFVDIKYYQNNGSHISNIDFPSEVFHVPRQLFYPLTMRPFGTLWLPSPRDTRSYLKAKYKQFVCQSGAWNHRLERRKNIRIVNCRRLSLYYPFVWRQRHKYGTVEILKIGRRIIHSIAFRYRYKGKNIPFIL